MGGKKWYDAGGGATRITGEGLVGGASNRQLEGGRVEASNNARRGACLGKQQAQQKDVGQVDASNTDRNGEWVAQHKEH